MIRVLLADDQALVRGALAAMLGLESDIEVVAQVGSGAEAVACGDGPPRRRGATGRPDARRGRPRRRRRAARRAADLPDRHPHHVRPPRLPARAMRAGASGFVVKDAPPEQLVDAVRRVHAGLRVVDPALAAESLSTGASPLTERERDVLRAAADGATVADGRRPPAPVGGHGAQPPVRGDRQDHRPHPRRGRAPRRRARLAVDDAAGPQAPRRSALRRSGSGHLRTHHRVPDLVPPIVLESVAVA